ncbi:MAG: BON domain-containing protein, partial [Gemmatimonadaceae bacterium]
KAVKGISSVADNATVAPPPPPVVISADDALKMTVAAALKDYSTVSADIKDGVVTLTGNIKKADLPKMMQALNALHPKKIMNKTTIAK